MSTADTIPGATGTIQQRVTEVIENEVPAAYADLATQRVIEVIDAWHEDARERAHEAAVAKLRSIYSGQIPGSVAREITDAVLDSINADRATEK